MPQTGSIVKNSTTSPLPLKSNSKGYCLFALGFIAIIGGAIATGCLYSRLKNTAFAIGGAGIGVGLVSFLMAKFVCSESQEIIPAKDSLVKKEDILTTLIEPVLRTKGTRGGFLIDFTRVTHENILDIFEWPKTLKSGEAAISRDNNTQCTLYIRHFQHNTNDTTIEGSFVPTTQKCVFHINDKGKVWVEGALEYTNYDNFASYLNSTVAWINARIVSRTDANNDKARLSGLLFNSKQGPLEFSYS